MRRILPLALAAVLSGCGPTTPPSGGSPTGSLAVSPQRAAWAETVRVTLPWPAGTVTATLGGTTVTTRTVAPDQIEVDVPADVWGGPQVLKVTSGPRTAEASLTVLGADVAASGGTEVLALLTPGAADSIVRKYGQTGIPLRGGTARVGTALRLGFGTGPCGQTLLRFDTTASGPGVGLGRLLEDLSAFLGEAVGTASILGIDPRSGWPTGPGEAFEGDPTDARATVLTSPSPAFTGRGVVVAVLDTGVAPLTFGSRLLTGVAADYTASPGAPTQDTFTRAVPGGVMKGHGTPIAVLAADATRGVAPSAGVWPLKVCGPDGRCQLEHLVAAVCAATTGQFPANRVVLNLSLGSDTPSEILYTVLSDAVVRGTLVAAAAGNAWNERGRLAGTLHHYPASYTGPAGLPRYVRPYAPAAFTTLPGVVSVAALRRDGSTLSPTSFSGRGDFVGIAAPGGNVTSLDPDGTGAAYVGTSFATGVVSGALAAWRESRPTASAAEIVAAARGAACRGTCGGVTVTGTIDATGQGLVRLP